MIPREVFLSHSAMDAGFARTVVEMLHRHGVPTWYSALNILPAEQWHDEIGAALKRCDWFLLVLSPHAVESMWVRRELFFALRQTRFQNRIVPVLHLPCDPEELSWVLPGLQMVDFQKDFHSGCRALLRVWGLGYKPA